jgi:hypothetical protein
MKTLSYPDLKDLKVLTTLTETGEELKTKFQTSFPSACRELKVRLPQLEEIGLLVSHPHTVTEQKYVYRLRQRMLMDGGGVELVRCSLDEGFIFV